jgi:hypothetical protein
MDFSHITDVRGYKHRYRHYKGGLYEIESFDVTWSGDADIGTTHMVLYRSVDSRKLYTRPHSEFFGEVEGGQRRFERIKTEDQA